MIWNRLGFGRRKERQRLCRHCSQPFRPERIGVVCRSERCDGVVDDLGRRNPRFFFADEQGLWRKNARGGAALDLDAPCPFCERSGRLATVCPHCRRPLGVESGEDRVIAVIGASASGKSHFLAAVLHQLLEAGVGGDTWRVALARPEVDRLRERLLDPLFRDLHVLPSTVDRLDEELAVPLENLEDGRRVLLVFRDLGGELFRQPERLARVAFLRYAQGVVLMVDPLAFREAGRGDGTPTARDTLAVYRRVLETSERSVEEAALPVMPEEKVLALAVTKADLVLPDRHPFWHDGAEPGDDGPPAYLRTGFWWHRKEPGPMSDAAVEDWVREHLDPALAREAGAFADLGWFFVSSLGYPHPPGNEHLSRAPDPRRVHEPIFALLDRLTADAPPRPGAEPAMASRRERGESSDDWGL